MRFIPDMSFQTVYLPSIQGITRVQNAAGGVGAANAASFTISFGSNLTVGNLVCVGICSQAPTNPIIAAASANTAIFAQSNPVAADVAVTVYTYIAWGKVIAANNRNITISTLDASSKTFCAVAAEYSGINICPDATPVAQVPGAVGTNINTGTITNIQPNALYIGILGQRFTTAAVNTAWLTSPGAPFTIVQQISTNLNGTNQDRGVGFLDAVVATSAARTANATSGFNGRPAGIAATFAEVPAAVPTGAAW